MIHVNFTHFSLQVHGEGTPAGRAKLLANDAIKYVDDHDVTDLKHHEVVQLIKTHSGLKMTVIVERLALVVSLSKVYSTFRYNREVTSVSFFAFF